MKKIFTIITIFALIGAGLFFPQKSIAGAIPDPSDLAFDTADALKKAALEIPATITQTANSTKNTVRENVLNVIAIQSAKILSAKLSQATYAWVAGGFENGQQLFVNSFEGFLREAGDQAIRKGLTELMSKSHLFLDGEFDISSGGYSNLDGVSALPDWIINYLNREYNKSENIQITSSEMNRLERLIEGVGVKFHSGINGVTATSCANTVTGCIGNANLATPTTIWTANNRCEYDSNFDSVLGYPFDIVCRIRNTTYDIKIGMRDGSILYFRTTAWLKDPYTWNSGLETGPNSFTDPITGQTITLPGGPFNPTIEAFEGAPVNVASNQKGKELVSKRGTDTPAKPYKTENWDRGELNAFANQITRTTVQAYHSTLAGTVETTLKEELGPNWTRFTDDATVGFNPLAPYASFELLLQPGNNPVGTMFETGNRIAQQAEKNLEQKMIKSQSSGIIPQELCEKKGSIAYPDGTTEETCERFNILTPVTSITGQLEADLMARADAKAITEWEQIGYEAVIGIASAAMKGGIALLSQDLKNASSEVSAQIKQLGSLSSIFGGAVDDLVTDSEDSWQMIAGRNINFADLNFQINLTAREARALYNLSDELERLAGPVMVLDQECVFGPDFGWEQRLRDNFRTDSERLSQAIQAIDGSQDEPNRKERARVNLFNFMEDALEDQISWTNDAMNSAHPFQFQATNLSFVNRIPPQLGRRQSYIDSAKEKQDAVQTLSNVREILRQTPGASILLTQAPTWSDSIEESLSFTSELASTGVSREEEFSRAEISNLAGRVETIAPIDENQLNIPVVNIIKPMIRVPAQSSPYYFNIMEGVTVENGNGDPINSNMTITITRYREDGGTPDVIFQGEPEIENQQLTYNLNLGESGNPEDVEDFFDATEFDDATYKVSLGMPDGTEKVITYGFNYLISYQATDSNGNQSPEVSRWVYVDTIDEHLNKLVIYNEEFNGFVQNLVNQPANIKRQLSRAVNLYLGVENSISSEGSLRNTESSVQQVKDNYEVAYELMDQCWLELYRLDKWIPIENIPGEKSNITYPQKNPTTTTTVVRGENSETITYPALLSSQYQNVWNTFISSRNVAIRSDYRIPYITKDLPYTIERQVASSAKLRDTLKSYSRPFTSIVNVINKAIDNAQDEGLSGLFSKNEQPQSAPVFVPDFRCELGVEAVISLREICASSQSSNTNACVSNVLRAYEDLHCISKADVWPETFNSSSAYAGDPFVPRVYMRKNSNLDNTRIQDAVYPGRQQIGTFEGTHPTIADYNSGRLAPLNCLASTAPKKGSAVGSPIDNCTFNLGTMIHKVPPIEEEFLVKERPYPLTINGRSIYTTGLTENYLWTILPFRDAWANPAEFNYNLPVQFSGWYPSADAPPNQRQWISGVVHSFETYKEHTMDILYCNTNSILFNTLHDFNEKWGVGNDEDKDEWWDGTYKEDDLITPNTAKVGSAMWRNVQRCADWTKSGLSDYLEFPKSN